MLVWPDGLGNALAEDETREHTLALGLSLEVAAEHLQDATCLVTHLLRCVLDVPVCYRTTLHYTL